MKIENVYVDVSKMSHVDVSYLAHQFSIISGKPIGDIAAFDNYKYMFINDDKIFVDNFSMVGLEKVSAHDVNEEYNKLVLKNYKEHISPEKPVGLFEDKEKLYVAEYEKDSIDGMLYAVATKEIILKHLHKEDIDTTKVKIYEVGNQVKFNIVAESIE